MKSTHPRITSRCTQKVIALLVKKSKASDLLSLAPASTTLATQLKKAGNSFAGKDRKYRILIGKTLENVLPANTDLNQIKTRDRITINNQAGIKIKWAEHYSHNSSNKREYQLLHVLERATTNTPRLHLN
ncbi:hypothetical protein BB561_005321 [Smittium simulii]|uniref:Uncharacterized protein n=1 Tax=Smittium simulii TaxID=133385 RepID=A0A2T9YAZ2_9FUNG|nr:hypothetical protein BB561_005321 [Smittium simulii]